MYSEVIRTNETAILLTVVKATLILSCSATPYCPSYTLLREKHCMQLINLISQHEHVCNKAYKIKLINNQENQYGAYL